MHAVYTLRLQDGCFYVGKVMHIGNLSRRLKQHRGIDELPGAAWTKMHPPLGTTDEDMQYCKPVETTNDFAELLTTLNSCIITIFS